jgi:hypothetical protein
MTQQDLADGLDFTCVENTTMFLASSRLTELARARRVTAPLGSTFHREVEFFRTSDTSALCNPRKRFFTDISKIIHDLHDANHAIILMLDANSVLTQDTFFRDSMEKLHLHDLHQSDPAPSTYIGSSNRRIDYIFGCQKVLTSLDQAGTLSYLDGPQSDHRGIFVDLNTSTLLHHHADDNRIQPPQVRRLKTGNPELVATYIKSMTEYYTNHNMVQRIADLHSNHQKMSDDVVRSLLESWDRDQGRAMLHSERLCGSRSQRNHWSPDLRNAGLTCRYWNLRFKEAINTYRRLHRHNPSVAPIGTTTHALIPVPIHKRFTVCFRHPC